MANLIHDVWHASPSRLEDVLAWTSLVLVVAAIASVLGVAGGHGSIPRGYLTWVFVAIALVYVRSYVRNAYHRPLETWGIALHVNLVLALVAFTIAGAVNERRR